MHDAVALANWICVLHPKKPTDIDFAFKEYYKERFPIAKETFANSQLMSKLVGKNLHAIIVKNTLKRFPVWLWKRMFIKAIKARPQVSFLPLVEDKGTVPPMRQPSLYKTLALLEKRAKEEAKKAHASAATVAV
ncbi:hypothetical protein BGZ93_003993 [Podila epicladia]|nr:hypothetical protein BGZ93_003993 [Podila epicladia]